MPGVCGLGDSLSVKGGSFRKIALMSDVRFFHAVTLRHRKMKQNRATLWGMNLSGSVENGRNTNKNGLFCGSKKSSFSRKRDQGSVKRIR